MKRALLAFVRWVIELLGLAISGAVVTAACIAAALAACALLDTYVW